MRLRLLLACLAVSGSPALLAAVSGTEVLDRGEQVFKTTCATGYCHGVDGTMAGAPRLAARGFDTAFIKAVISKGVERTSMPGFAASLPAADLLAVMTYVARLNDIRDPVFTQSGGLGVAEPAAPKTRSAAAERGKALFSDAVRSVNRCSSCHEVAGIGIPVTGPIRNLPASAATLRAAGSAQVKDVVVDGETLPALTVANRASGIMFYDLTVAPPVLRTLPAGGQLPQGRDSQWSHRKFIASYSDAELADVLRYLQEELR